MLKVTEHGEVGEIMLDRPPVNAMNQALVDDLMAAYTRLGDDGARAVVISGREGLFSAGLDVPELLQLSREQILCFWESFFQLMSALAGSKIPVVAAITGHAPAGGAVLALHCDYRVATRGDFYIGLNEVQVGLPVPPNILFMLELVVGHRQAALLASSGRLLSPEQALQCGFIDDLVDSGKSVSTALEWAEKLLELPPAAMNTTRLSAKAAVIERARDNENYAVTATDYWFSEETQETMRKLVENLAAKSN